MSSGVILSTFLLIRTTSQVILITSELVRRLD